MLVPSTFRAHASRSSHGAPRRLPTRLPLVAMLGAAAIASVVGGALLAQPASAAGVNLFVATTGSDGGGNNCQTAGTPCATLAYALTQAATSDTIMIAPGTYTMAAGSSNTVPAALTGLTIESNGGTASNTIINGTGGINGLAINANNVTVDNLTIENTGAAGILISPPQSATPPATVSGALIENVVINNADQCMNTPSTAACTAAIGAGDYGETIWLLSVTNSTVENSTFEGGLDGGILVSDEMGPADGNTINNNMVVDNALGCGITLAAHNMSGFPAPQPTVGGVYNNTVSNNISEDNGATGIGLFNAAFNNTIEGNTFEGNGEPGVVINPTFPIGDVNGNQVIGNTFGVNSLHDGPGGNTGNHNAHTTQTIGIIVVDAGAPVTGTVIQNNAISGNYYGIYLSANSSSATLSGNSITVTSGGKAVFIAPAPSKGYWQVGSDGGIFAFGQAPFEGSTGGKKLNQPVIGMAPTPDGGGYWLVAKDGGVFNFGSASFYGSLPGLKVKVSNVVGIAANADGGGYWLVAKDGGVFGFGDAKYFGSLPALNVKVSDIVGIAPTSDGNGYWLVAKDGGVFGFGDAKYFGSLPALNVKVSNVVGIAPTSDGNGYWLVGSDGGVFNFGDAGFFGSLPGLNVKVSDILEIATTP